MTTISSRDLAAVSGGRTLHVRAPQTDKNGAIVGGNVVGQREDNFSCNGAICGGERFRVRFF